MRRFLNSSTRLAVGLILIGAAGYYLLALAGRTLSAESASAVASLYLMANIVGPGIAIPVEQETNRAISEARAWGFEQSPIIRHMSRLAGLLMLVAGVVVCAVSPVLVAGPLHGSWGLLASLLVCVVSFGTLAVARGVLAGRRQYRGYALTLILEGATRLAPLAALGVAGISNAVLYCMVFAFGGAFALIGGCLALWRPGTDGADEPAEAPTGGARPPVPTLKVLGVGLLQLLGASLLMQTMANVAPIIVNTRLHDNAELAAAVAQAFVLTRIPLFLFSPLQSMLMPSLVDSVTRHDRAAVRSRVTTVMLVLVGIGALGVVGSAALGPTVLRVFFGADADVSRTALAALAVGTVGLMVMQVLQPALVAAHRHRWVTWSWTAGTAGMFALLFIPGDAVFWAVTAQIVGPALAIVVAATGLVLYLREPAPGEGAEAAGDRSRTAQGTGAGTAESVGAQSAVSAVRRTEP
ncbi:lipopolysaccharide biosynthesis protein [Yinghuangia seranimata]|uniref:lipopolysaccharide biosynthesis protein n=1 Tax=Yinghuangia seranimata TaxID=408067 RepID=UPI00248CE395|nr:hypothetical protein [Yinghuangia seranimata]MDI2131707.1 hypothetical protein [Yinghuangia seranimata]